MRRSPATATLFVLAVVGAACSSGSSSSDTAAASTAVTPTASPTSTAAPATTISPADAAKAYIEPGPYPVGVTTLALANGTKVEVWYPAVAGTAGRETYDVRDFTPAAIKALLTADVPATFTYDAGRDADVADGRFPIVAFSHGAIGFRVQSTFLTAHLAGWGMVVVSADHPSRDLPHLLDLLNVSSRPADTSVGELTGALDLIINEGTTSGSRFFGRIDATKVATIGHSAGGVTAFRAAADPRVLGYVSMASGVVGFRGNSSAPSTSAAPTTTTTTTDPVFPSKPSFFIAGDADNVLPVDEVTRPSFEKAPAPSLLWVINGAGHLAFSDVCTFGNGRGIIGVAEASGLGSFLASAPFIIKLGSDGCNPPAIPVATTFPIIDHAVTAWLRNLFGIDAAPVGLDGTVANAFATPVVIDTK